MEHTLHSVKAAINFLKLAMTEQAHIELRSCGQPIFAAVKGCNRLVVAPSKAILTIAVPAIDNPTLDSSLRINWSSSNGPTPNKHAILQAISAWDRDTQEAFNRLYDMVVRWGGVRRFHYGLSTVTLTTTSKGLQFKTKSSPAIIAAGPIELDAVHRTLFGDRNGDLSSRGRIESLLGGIVPLSIRM